MSFADYPQLLSLVPAAEPRAVGLHGNVAYVAARENLLIVDIGDLRLSSIVNRLPEFAEATDVEVAGDFAYVTSTSGRLTILDVSDPLSPVVIGSVELGQYISDLELSGDIACAALHDRLVLIGLDTPTAPRLLGSISLSDSPFRVAVQNDLAYVGTWTGGLHIVDITRPASPFLITTFRTPGTAHDVAVSGNWAYVADRLHGLQVVDVTDSRSPRIVATVPNEYTSMRIELAGQYVYLADSYAGVKVIDVSNPRAPRLAARLGGTNVQLSEAAFSGTTAFFPDQQDAVLQIFDVSHVALPQVLGGTATDSHIARFQVRGHTLFAAGSPTLQTYDLSSPRAPIPLATLDAGNRGYDLVLRDEYAFVAADDAGLCVVDIADPRHPRLVTKLRMGGSFDGIEVRDGYAYVTSFWEHLYIYDLQDPTQPRYMSTLILPGNACAVRVRDDIAYIAEEGLAIADVRNKAHPILLSNVQFPSGGGFMDVELRGDFAFVSNEGAGKVVVFDISDPKRPREVANIPTACRAMAIRLEGPRLYVAASYAGVEAIDITDPTRPRVEGFSGVPYSVFGVTDMAEARGFLYAAMYVGGLHVLPIPGQAPVPADLKSTGAPGQGAGGAAPQVVVGPNPTGPAATVSFVLGREQNVGLDVYDVRGRLVTRLAEGFLTAGDHVVRWDGSDLAGRRAPSGVYILRMRADGVARSQRFTLLR